MFCMKGAANIGLEYQLQFAIKIHAVSLVKTFKLHAIVTIVTFSVIIMNFISKLAPMSFLKQFRSRKYSTDRLH